MKQKNIYDYIGIIELENGNYYDVVKVTTKDGVYLEAGCATNTGFISFYGIDFDNDSLDACLSDLYEKIVECQEEARTSIIY